MNLQQRINAFVKLGDFLSQFSPDGIHKKDTIEKNDLFFDGFKHQIKLAEEHNAWFNKENVLFSLDEWSKSLNNSNINKWIEKYNFNSFKSKKVAIIMAGNIPLVGFHDFISVLISGHSVVVKQSSNDKHLLPFLAKYLEHIEPEFKDKIEFTEEKLTQFDAVIATGSDNTARYFEFYFKNKPSIIRKNRNSVAVLTGNENENQLLNLSEDIFRYYGLGCRNVSKLFVPKDYINQFMSLNNLRLKKSIKKHRSLDLSNNKLLNSVYKTADNRKFVVKTDKKLNKIERLIQSARAIIEKYFEKKEVNNIQKITDDLKITELKLKIELLENTIRNKR